MCSCNYNSGNATKEGQESVARRIEGLCVGVGRRSGDLQGAWRSRSGQRGASRGAEGGGSQQQPLDRVHSSRRMKPRARSLHGQPAGMSRDHSRSRWKAPALCTEVSQKHTKGVPGPPGPTAPSQHPLPDSTGEESPQHKDHQAGPTLVPHL